MTINGNYNGYLSDPTIEILFTFRNIKFLRLNSIYINNEKLATLQLNEFHTLILENCTLIDTHDSRLTKILLNQGRNLKALQIAFKGFNTNMSKVIKEVIQNIQTTNIEKLKISLILNAQNLLILMKNLPKSRTLKLLTIFKVNNGENLNDDEFLEKLKSLKLEIDIQEFTYDSPQLKNKHWYH